jgi:hypothetical protein
MVVCVSRYNLLFLNVSIRSFCLFVCLSFYAISCLLAFLAFLFVFYLCNLSFSFCLLWCISESLISIELLSFLIVTSPFVLFVLSDIGLTFALIDSTDIFSTQTVFFGHFEMILCFVHCTDYVPYKSKVIVTLKPFLVLRLK